MQCFYVVSPQIRFPGDRLNEGDNSVLLTITTSDGRRHEVRLSLTVQVQRPTETEPPSSKKTLYSLLQLQVLKIQFLDDVYILNAHD